MHVNAFPTPYASHNITLCLMLLRARFFARCLCRHLHAMATWNFHTHICLVSQEHTPRQSSTMHDPSDRHRRTQILRSNQGRPFQIAIITLSGRQTVNVTRNGSLKRIRGISL
ncbi:hypothetical protein GGR50DRAFT_669797 [Xylaria sp. CBS 124048]|nr:hypothetical protein GGR50DRAFT_669797 [Xylaria sp. CBS 124048]